MVKLTSKEIRQEITQLDPICIFKLGAINTPSVSLNWGYALSKVTSVRHKSCLLRVAHGEVYTKEKLHRFNLMDSPSCPRCGEVENLEHKFITCAYVERIWQEAFRLISRLIDLDLNEDKSNLIIGLVAGTEPLNLSIQAEILQRIMYFKDDASYLLRPKVLVQQAIGLLARREKVNATRDRLKDLLED